MDPKERAQAGTLKVLAIKKAKELSGDSRWDLVEQIAQEIQAHYVLKKEKLTAIKHIEFIEQEIRSRYSDQPDVMQILLDAVPSTTTLGNWKKKKEWEEAVWIKLRGEGLFTPDSRAQVISRLFDQALQGNVPAAKIWLTLSGDYVEKGDSGKNGDAMDLFRQINEAIHKGK